MLVRLLFISTQRLELTIKIRIIKQIYKTFNVIFKNQTTTMNQTKKIYTAPALDKGLSIIELLAGEELGLSLTDIARALTRSVGEIFRMLAVLEQRGYVTQDIVSGRYVLTTFLFEIAHKLPNVRRLTSVAEPRMRRLVRKINQSVHLGIITNNEVLIIGQVDNPANSVMSVRIGAKIEMLQASSGRVIMAYLPEEELETLLSAVKFTGDITKSEFMQDLANIRKKTFEVRESFVVQGINNISAPVLNHSGNAVAALTVPYVVYKNEHISFASCVDILVKTANEISGALGANAVRITTGNSDNQANGRQ